MTNKKDFHFDFNEDADPVDELHRLRVATAKHFKTLEAYMEYLRATPSIPEILAELDAEIAKKRAKAAAKAGTSPARQSPAPRRQAPASRRRRAAAHA